MDDNYCIWLNFTDFSYFAHSHQHNLLTLPLTVTLPLTITLTPTLTLTLTSPSVTLTLILPHTLTLTLTRTRYMTDIGVLQGLRVEDDEGSSVGRAWWCWTHFLFLVSLPACSAFSYYMLFVSSSFYLFCVIFVTCCVWFLLPLHGVCLIFVTLFISAIVCLYCTCCVRYLLPLSSLISSFVAPIVGMNIAYFSQYLLLYVKFFCCHYRNHDDKSII